MFDYYTIGRDAEEKRKVDPYHLLFRGGQFYLIGHSHERDAVRVFRVSRIRGKVGYSSKAEHDFNRPEDFDPRIYATRTDWQLGDPAGRGAHLAVGPHRLAGAAPLRPCRRRDRGRGRARSSRPTTPTRASCSPGCWGWATRPGSSGPTSWSRSATSALRVVIERHTGTPELASRARRRRAAPEEEDPEDRGEAPIRPERFARLVTLAGMLIDAAREGHKLEVVELCESLQISDTELRQDIDVLNVVNFGGGSYVLYAEIQGGQIEVDPEPYGDNFARPARLLPLEAKALVAAIDLIGEHLPEGSLATARQKIVDALGQDPAAEGLQITTAKGDDSEVARVVSGAIVGRKLLRIEYYKENEDEFTERTIEPYKLANGQEGWYVHSYDLEKDAPRSYRLDRIREATVLDETFEPREGIEPDVEGWLSTGEVPASPLPASGSHPTVPAGRGRTGAWWTSSPTDPWWWSAPSPPTSGWPARS